jgi:hypothetical protein
MFIDTEIAGIQKQSNKKILKTSSCPVCHGDDNNNDNVFAIKPESLKMYLMAGMPQDRSDVKHVIYSSIGITCGVHVVELD